MKEIIDRLTENRQIELAKSILESSGYKVSKRLTEGGYEYIKSKSVTDSDGFTTDYTMYRDNSEDDKYVFVFGDKDIYNPDNSESDYLAYSEEEAEEWFNAYEGVDDEDDYEFPDYSEEESDGDDDLSWH